MHMCIKMFLKIVRINDVIGPTSSAVLDAILEKNVKQIFMILKNSKIKQNIFNKCDFVAMLF